MCVYLVKHVVIGPVNHVYDWRVTAEKLCPTMLLRPSHPTPNRGSRKEVASWEWLAEPPNNKLSSSLEKQQMETSKLKSEYEKVLPRLEKVKARLVPEITELLAQNAIYLAIPLEARIKSWASISSKLDRKNLQLSSVKDLVDLVGIRIVLPFLRDVDLTTRLLESVFNISDREEKLTRLSEARFGYQSTHLQATLNDAWRQLPSFTGCGDLSVELQIRTISQHTWAVVSHKLQYKQESSVPIELKRSVNRMAALLETVDLEFERVVGQHEELLQTHDESDPQDERLTWEVFSLILDEHLPRENRRSNQDDGLLQELFRAGISTRKRCVALFNAYGSQVTKLEDLLTKEPDVMQAFRDMGKERFRYSDIGFTRIMLGFRAGDIQNRLLQRKK